MAGQSNEIFDVRRIRRLVELMQEHDLMEMDLQQGETRIQLRRARETASVLSGAPAPVAYTPAPVAAAPVVVPAAPVSAAPLAPAPAPSAEGSHVAVIKSPMVGTFYSASDPDSPSFVKVGDAIGPDTTVCLIEAMKVFNEIQAEVSGKIIAVLVKNGEPVEFGQPLFKVDTSA